MEDSSRSCEALPPVSPNRGCMGMSSSSQSWPSGLGRSASEPGLQGGPAPRRGKPASPQATQGKGFLGRQLAHPSVEARRKVAARQRALAQEKSAGEEHWGTAGVEGLHHFLQAHYGSVIAGWRALDTHQNGRLSFQELCTACRKVGFHGNLKKLWKELDVNDNGFVTIGEIDPEVGTVVGQFKLELWKKYGDMVTAWRKGLDVNGNGRIDEKEIADCCERLGLSVNTKKLYKMLKASGLGLTFADFDPHAHKRWLTGDVGGLVTGNSTEFVEETAGYRRMSGSLPAELLAQGRKDIRRGGLKAWRKELISQELAEVQAAVSENRRLRVGLHTIKGFKHALITRCGSLYGAWKQALDLDGNGRLTFGEFCQALHRLGFHGDVKGLWYQLDVRGNGYVEFSDFDPETDAMVSEFRKALIDKHGNMLMAWLNEIDPDNTGHADEAKFIQACRRIGFSRKPERLFHLMVPEAGRPVLTLKDFDGKAYDAFLHGDFRMISEPKDAPQPGDKRGLRERPDQLAMSFDERQQSSFYFQMKRAMDAASRSEYAAICQMDRQSEFRIDSLEKFEHLCVRKYGSLFGAWQLCLDNDHNGKLTFNEFCVGCRRLGYTGDLKALWAQYDSDNQGFVSLDRVDRDSYEIVSDFFEMFIEEYGEHPRDLDQAWVSGFKKDLHENIDEKTLEAACAKIKYPHDAHKLFGCLQPIAGKVLFAIHDFHTLFLCVQNKRKPKGGAQKRPQSRPGTQDSAEGTAPAAQPKPSALTRAGLHKVLTREYGSTAAAWQEGLDPRGRGTVVFSRFSSVLQSCAMAGNFKALWSELSEGRDSISFGDVDGRAQELLTECREQLLGRYGSLTEAWAKGLDADGLGRLDKDDFVGALKESSIASKDPHALFKLLLTRHGQRSIPLINLRPLLIGVPLAERGAAWGGDGWMRATQSLSGPGAPSPRSQASKQLLDFRSQDKIITSLDAFKKHLVHKFGSFLAAWKFLDADHNGIVTKVDFAKTCQHLGVQSTHDLWRAIDVDRSGQITLKELDPATAQAFEELERLLIGSHGSTKEGWRKVFDADKSTQCQMPKFVAGCKALGYSGDAEVLFRLLLPETGRKHLSYKDLWLDLNPNDFRMPGAVTETKSPLKNLRSKSSTA